uniref:Transcription factor E2F7 n=1 Tax=Pavo cristatus TaxID=9049 RepID=A0A8C9LFN8_PAVCR
MEANVLSLRDLAAVRPSRRGRAEAEAAQKENILDRSRMAPKTPIKNDPVDLSKQKGCTPDRNPMTPVKLIDRPQADPWTPTANLKMLISAASPDMRDREKKKELFRPIENSEQNDVPDSLQYDMVDDGTVDEFEKQRPSRKQKSLGLLCQKFLARYPSYPLSTEKTTISLDEVASILGVGRRRIYDIVNVLESLHLVSRVAKNQYCWHGRHNLSQTLKTLREAGELQYGELVTSQYKEQDTEHKSGEQKNETVPDSQDRPLLDFAEPDCTSAKVRRLYDIANVLTSLCLIKKVHVTEERGRKPAFKWIGPVDFPGKTDEPRGHCPTSGPPAEARRGACAPYQICATGKQRFTRHASFNGAQPCEGTKRKVSSEPNSPNRERQGCIVNSDEYCSKMINLATVCRQKIEEDTRSKVCATEAVFNAARNPSVTSPLSLLPVPGDSDFCANPLSQAVFPVVQADMPSLLLPKGVSSQALHPSSAAASKTENGKPPLLPSQPFLCFPSSSFFMLCGGLQEDLSRESGSTGEKALPPEAQGAVPPANCQKRSSHRCTSPSAPTDDEEPAAKKQTVEQSDVPISLVVPKKPVESPKADAAPGSGCASAVHLEAFHLDLSNPTAPETADKKSTKPLDSQEQEKWSQNKDLNEPSPGKDHISKENTNQPFVPQYLYVQPAAGLSSFNFLFSANQAPSAIGLAASQLPSLSVPYVMVPSAALASFPLVCSPAIPSPLPPVPDGSPAAASMSISMPGLASTTPVFIGTTAVVTPNASPSPSVDPQRTAHPAAHPRPVLARSCSAVKLDSSVCVGHPVTLLKLQQPSSTPVTPKSVRPARHEAFFKTPGSLGDPGAWKKSEGNQTRSASSVQRRLEISSTSTD